MAMYLHFKCPTILWILLLLHTNLINTDSNIQDIQRQSTSLSDDFELCKKGETLRNHALRGGRKAGAYYKIGKVQTFDECIDLCCSSDCSLALFVKRNCYSVKCNSAQLCKPIKVHRAIKPSIFRRYRATVTHGRDASLPLPNLVGSNVTLKREKRFGSCQHYTGTVCSKYLDPDRLVYYDEPPNAVEKRLSGPLTVIQGRFKSHCKKFALPALCLYSFPYCEAKPHPQPVRLCKDDCEQLYDGVCNHDFNLAKRVALKYPPLLKIIPDCANLTTLTKEGDDCVKLGLNGDDEAMSDFSTLETTYAKSDKTTPLVKPSSHYSTHENKAQFTKSSPPTLKTTNANISPLQPTHANTDNVNFDVKDASKTPSIDTLDNLNSDVKIESEAPSSHTQTQTIPSTIQTTQTQDQSDKISSEVETKKSILKTTDIQLNSTNKLQDQTSYTLPAVSPTKVSPSSLLSSVFTKQKDAGLMSDTEKTNSNGSSVVTVGDTGEQHTVINVNSSTDEVDFETEDKDTKKESDTVSILKLKKPPTKASIIHLQVSTVGDKVITLTKDTASLYASAWPKETPAHPYTYQWLQISSPQNSHGYMEGKNAPRVVLSQLKKPGVYQLEVIVRSSHYAYGRTFVNVTVEKPKRLNKPPRADISPKEQSITLPTNEVVLDGSKSSDDDKIVEYKWQELKGPLTEKNKIIKSGVDSPVLQLKSLLPGVYTYKLTVKDADDETDSATATVTVNAEKDYLPVARAGNDVVITLPENFVTLYGNGSTDDHGIKSYEWSKSPLSPACDLQGSTGPILLVSNMIVGDYTFTLKVTDSGGQSSESKVTVVVRPEKNSPPIAKAGDDKDLVFPDDSTTLSAQESSDDQGITSYKWEKISGPLSVVMSGVDKMVLNLSHLKEGHYVFKLTVTDAKGLRGTDRVSVNVKRDGNKRPHADAGPDVFVKLPNRAAALDGSSSSDDYGIVSYTWTRDLKSPAAGDVINGSNHQPILRLSNLVKGVYQFRLTVKDAKGLESYDDAKIFVKEDVNSPSLVELYLDVDITSFTEENKRQLVRKLAVSLNVMDSDIVIEHIQPSGRGNSLVVLFYVQDSLIKKSRDGKEIAYLLKQKLSDNFFEFRMQEVEPYVCRNNCSGHGFCDQHTKQCICESFWMQDPFKARFGLRESNCDWSILYVTVIIFAVIVAIVGITWGVCFCMGRTKSRRKKQQYSMIGDEDSDDAKNATMELFPRDKFLNSSIMSETDMDSDEETLFENHKPYKPGRTSQMNGMLNGAKKKNHHT